MLSYLGHWSCTNGLAGRRAASCVHLALHLHLSHGENTFTHTPSKR